MSSLFVGVSTRNVNFVQRIELQADQHLHQSYLATTRADT